LHNTLSDLRVAFCICSIWSDSVYFDNGLIRKWPDEYLAVLNRGKLPPVLRRAAGVGFLVQLPVVGLRAGQPEVVYLVDFPGSEPCRRRWFAYQRARSCAAPDRAARTSNRHGRPTAPATHRHKTTRSFGSAASAAVTVFLAHLDLPSVRAS